MFHTLTVTQEWRGRWQGLSMSWHVIAEMVFSDDIADTGNRAKKKKCKHQPISEFCRYAGPTDPQLCGCAPSSQFCPCLKFKVPPSDIFYLLPLWQLHCVFVPSLCLIHYTACPHSLWCSCQSSWPQLLYLNMYKSCVTWGSNELHLVRLPVAASGLRSCFRGLKTILII